MFTFSIILCDNEIDRDNERFSEQALDKLAQLFIGKTGIFDHNPKGENQTARIFQAEVIIDDEKQNSLAMPYTYLKASAYMMRNSKNKDLIMDIDAGIKKEVSISCNVEKVVCSVCGANQKNSPCEHYKGNSYKNKLCYYQLEQVKDAYEWSFVAVPAQQNAGVIKSYKQTKEVKPMKELQCILKQITTPPQQGVTLTIKECQAISQHIADLTKQAEYGLSYKSELVCKVKSLAVLTNDIIPIGVVDSVVQKMTIEELQAFKKAYEQRLDIGATPQLMSSNIKQNQKPEYNQSYKTGGLI